MAIPDSRQRWQVSATRSAEKDRPRRPLTTQTASPARPFHRRRCRRAKSPAGSIRPKRDPIRPGAADPAVPGARATNGGPGVSPPAHRAIRWVKSRPDQILTPATTPDDSSDQQVSRRSPSSSHPVNESQGSIRSPPGGARPPPAGSIVPPPHGSQRRGADLPNEIRFIRAQAAGRRIHPRHLAEMLWAHSSISAAAGTPRPLGSDPAAISAWSRRKSASAITSGGHRDARSPAQVALAPAEAAMSRPRGTAHAPRIGLST